MPPVPQQVLIPDDLPSAKSPERAAIHQAALEWSILAPIIIRTQEDVKSRVRWAADLEPFSTRSAGDCRCPSSPTTWGSARPSLPD